MASWRQGHVTPQHYHCQADLSALSRRGTLAQPGVLAEALVHNGLQTASKHLEVGSARFWLLEVALVPLSKSHNGPLNATRAADNSGDEGKYTLGRCPDDFRILFTFPRANDHPTVLLQTICIFNFKLFNSIFNFQDARTIFIFCTHSRELMRSPLIYFRLHLYIDAFSITIVHKFVISSSAH